MIDSASVVAIADQVKTTLDQGKVLVDAWSVVIVSIIGLVAYVLGILSGKKSEPAKKE